MKLPQQAQPVSRGFGATAGVHAGHGVFPSNGCPRGQWCCRVRGVRNCYNCSSTIFGTCVSGQEDDCRRVGGAPDNCDTIH